MCIRHEIRWRCGHLLKRYQICGQDGSRLANGVKPDADDKVPNPRPIPCSDITDDPPIRLHHCCNERCCLSHIAGYKQFRENLQKLGIVAKDVGLPETILNGNPSTSLPIPQGLFSNQYMYEQWQRKIVRDWYEIRGQVQAGLSSHQACRDLQIFRSVDRVADGGVYGQGRGAPSMPSIASWLQGT